MIQQTIALLHWFRRLLIRWEIRDDIHEASMALAAAIIFWRQAGPASRHDQLLSRCTCRQASAGQPSRLNASLRVWGEQAGADVADDVGGQVAEVVPADLAALAWFGVDWFSGPPGSGEEHSDAGLAVRVGVAALGLVAAAGPSDPRQRIAALDGPGLGALLRHVWGLSGITRPELSIRVGPLARWLEDATQAQLAQALAVTWAVTGTGELFASTGRNVVKHADLLGSVY